MSKVETPSAKAYPETLQLRARPPRAIRFKRGLIMVAASMGALGIAGLSWYGLQKPQPHPSTADQATSPPASAGAMEVKTAGPVGALPATYDVVGARAPLLGPPLPGGFRTINTPEASSVEDQTDGPSKSTQEGTAQLSADKGLFFRSSQSLPPSAPASFDGTAQASKDSPEPIGLGATTAASSKLAFMQSGLSETTKNSHSLEDPPSPYAVLSGTVIPASLITGLNSDLPGPVMAQVTQNVFDSVSGRTLLIPQGTRLIGAYDSLIAFGQTRALLVWKRMILPDGSSISIDNMPAADRSGYAGLSDQIDYHSYSLLKGFGLSTLVGLTALSGGSNDSDLVKILRDSVRDSANQAGQRVVEKALSVQPSLSVRPGYPLLVIVQKDLILRPFTP